MEFRKFCDDVMDRIRDYLPVQYQNADITLQETVKNADVHLTGLIIRGEGELITPCIYLDQYHIQHEDGRDMASILSEIADSRVQSAVLDQMDTRDLFMSLLEDYNQAKEHLQIRLCDPVMNMERLDRCTYTMEGDFAATYHIALDEIPGIGQGTVAVTRELLMKWDVPVQQLKEDALRCDLQREPQLVNIGDMMARFGMPLPDAVPGSGMGNLLTKDPDSVRLNDMLYVLTNRDSLNGASLILQRDVMKKIGELAGGDFYVLPSSVHETLIIPESAGVSLDDLSEMVKSVNSSTVSPEEFLSDHVQYYDAGRELLMNAEHYRMLQLPSLEKTNVR